MRNNREGVIVLGGHVQGLGIVRILGEKKIKSILLDYNKQNITKHSKYCSEFIWYRKENLLNALLSLESQYGGWLIVPTDDSHIEVISKNHTLLSKIFKLSTQEWSVIENFYNKKRTYQLCNNLNIPIPNSYFPETEIDLFNCNLNFPVIIKPAVMHTFYNETKRKVFVCKDKNELLKFYREASKIIPSEEIIVQEVIPGDSENQYSVCFYFNEVPKVSLIAKRSRQHPIDFGNATTFAETVPYIKKLYTRASNLLSMVKYVGFAEVEFKYDERINEFLFLEVNPRTWKWHSISKHSESPFIEAFYNYCFNKEEIVANTWQNAAFQDIITDFPTVLKLFFKGQYKRKNYHKVVHAVWDIKDPKPFLYELLYLPSLIMKR